ncbi:pantoate--beta-alanine ligase [bacterium]|nr:MAG: pantoate--beta-alanine ligase [bacterium]
MGALHEGHLELVRQARSRAKTVVVSIFVNPTQFGPNEDFTRYPRDLERDATLAESAGADIVYAPSVETMYPRGTMAKVVVPEVTEWYEGAHRPGHFDGVATVVLKLFNQVRPDIAFFGRKDLQQCAVIRRMVEDLNVPVELAFIPTFREEDGLALSSRNVYLSAEERRVAAKLHETLVDTAHDLQTGADPAVVLTAARKRLTELGFDWDYFDLVSSHRFVPLDRPTEDAAVVVAARLGKTRLIDNVELNEP